MSEVITRTSTEIFIDVVLPNEDESRPRQSIVFFGNPEHKEYLASMCYGLIICFLKVGLVSEEQENGTAHRVALSCEAMFDEINDLKSENSRFISVGERVPILDDDGQVLLFLVPRAVTSVIEFGAIPNTEEIKEPRYRLSKLATPKRKIV